MLKFLASSLVASAVLAATPSFAAVRLLTVCQTTDGQYSVAIVDNQGIGSVRTSRLIAEIKNASDAVVGSFRVVKLNTGVARSASFGHTTLVDQQTQGQQFAFDYPSTNTGYALTAVLSDGSELSYGQDSLTCSQY